MAAASDPRVPQVLPARRVLLVPQVLPVLQVLPAPLALPVLRLPPAPQIQPVTKGGKQIFRVSVPARSFESANAMCAAIKSSGGGCYVTQGSG